MSLIFYDIQRSFNEYINDNLSTQSGEVIKYEFPLDVIGSHTYSVEFISDTPIPVNGRSVGSNTYGRNIESLAQIDVFRLPSTSGEADVAGAKKMISRVTDLFKGTHYIPLNDYGATPTGATVGTVNGAIKVDESESSKLAFEPNPQIRRYTTVLNLNTVETF